MKIAVKEEHSARVQQKASKQEMEKEGKTMHYRLLFSILTLVSLYFVHRSFFLPYSKPAGVWNNLYQISSMFVDAALRLAQAGAGSSSSTSPRGLPFSPDPSHSRFPGFSALKSDSTYSGGVEMKEMETHSTHLGEETTEWEANPSQTVQTRHSSIRHRTKDKKR
jgi:hypothetical protein